MVDDRLRSADRFADGVDVPASTVPRILAIRSVWLWMAIAIFALGAIALIAFSGVDRVITLMTSMFCVAGVVGSIMRLLDFRQWRRAVLVRRAVRVVSTFTIGRVFRSYFAVVENSRGLRLTIEVLDPSLIVAGTIGVLFARGDLVWAFHRLD